MRAWRASSCWTRKASAWAAASAAACAAASAATSSCAELSENSAPISASASAPATCCFDHLVGVEARLDRLGPGRNTGHRFLTGRRAIDRGPSQFLKLAQGGLALQLAVVELLQAFLGLAAKRVTRKARLGEHGGRQDGERGNNGENQKAGEVATRGIGLGSVSGGFLSSSRSAERVLFKVGSSSMARSTSWAADLYRRRATNADRGSRKTRRRWERSAGPW